MTAAEAVADAPTHGVVLLLWERVGGEPSAYRILFDGSATECNEFTTHLVMGLIVQPPFVNGLALVMTAEDVDKLERVNAEETAKHATTVEPTVQ